MMAVSAFEHADEAAAALREIAAECGPDVLSDPTMLASLLADSLPAAPGAIRVLVAAAEDGVADGLRDHVTQGLTVDAAARLAASSFARTSMFPPDVCAWVADAFAGAAGLRDGSAQPGPGATAEITADWAPGQTPSDGRITVAPGPYQATPSQATPSQPTQFQVTPNQATPNQPPQYQATPNQQFANQPPQYQELQFQPAQYQPPYQRVPIQARPNPVVPNPVVPNQPAPYQPPPYQPVPNQPAQNQPAPNQPAPNQASPIRPFPNQPFAGPGQLPQPVAPRPAAPQPVLNAVMLMYSGAALSILVLLIDIATKGSLDAAIFRQHPFYTTTQVDADKISFFLFQGLVAVIGCGLWITMAQANRAGKRWARTVATILFGIFTLYTLVSLGGIGSAASKAFDALTWIVAVLIVVLLWRPASSAFFRFPVQAKQPTGTPGYGNPA
jgi:hypothetical protein